MKKKSPQSLSKKKLSLSKKLSIKPTITHEDDVPVTQKMLFEVRNELKADIRSLDSKMDSRFAAVDSKLEQMNSSIHKIALAVEQQNARNNVVLDGLTSLFQRQENLEKKFSEFEVAVLDLKKPI